MNIIDLVKNIELLLAEVRIMVAWPKLYDKLQNRKESVPVIHEIPGLYQAIMKGSVITARSFIDFLNNNKENNNSLVIDCLRKELSARTGINAIGNPISKKHNKYFDKQFRPLSNNYAHLTQLSKSGIEILEVINKIKIYLRENLLSILIELDKILSTEYCNIFDKLLS